jgi:XTP/dITP diphosphohydrolase
VKIIYGTKNKAKLEDMRKILNGLDFEITGLEDITEKIPEVEESGNDPLKNAEIKATAYYKILKRPVFSCDSGLFIEGLEEKLQPGVYVRRVNGRYMNDAEMIDYYSRLAGMFEKDCIARYQNAICLILDEKNIFSYSGYDISGERFILSPKRHEIYNEGYPLDSISIDMASGKYYVEMDNEKDTLSHEEGFRKFFQSVLEKYIKL